MDRRSTLFGLSSSVVSGSALSASLQGWLSAFDKNTAAAQSKLAGPMGKLGATEINNLEQAARNLYYARMRYGTGPNRRIAIALLHEVSVAVQEKQTPNIQLALFRIMADLAETVAKMTWHEGQERNAQEYFQLALRAAHAGQDRLLGARILVNLASQMYYLGKPQDSLKIIHLAKRSSKAVASAQVKLLLNINEAWAYAALGQSDNFQRTIALAEENLLTINDHEPYWVRYCDASELAGMAGGGLRLLALHKPKQYAEKASELNANAIALRTDPMHSYSVLDYCGLAESRFLLKDTELAFDATEKAIRICHKLQNRCGTSRRRLTDLSQYTKQTAQTKQQHTINAKIHALINLA